MERQEEESLDGKVAIITGASRGIGRRVAIMLAARGVKVVAAVRSVEEADLVRLVDAAVDRFGGVDILVNNAATLGHNWWAGILDLPREDWRYHFAVNLDAPFTLIQRVVPIMEQRGGGRVLNTTTGSAESMREPEEPLQGAFMAAPAYFSSKRALDRLANRIAGRIFFAPRELEALGLEIDDASRA